MWEKDYLYTEGLSVGYKDVPLIRDITLGLKKGEILTLIGPNGAGKTTILKSLIRQLAPLGGAVFLDGRKTSTISGKEWSRKLSVVLTDRVRTELMTCAEAAKLEEAILLREGTAVVCCVCPDPEAALKIIGW